MGQVLTFLLTGRTLPSTQGSSAHRIEPKTRGWELFDEK